MHTIRKKGDWFILVGSANASELYYNSSRLNDNSLNVHKAGDVMTILEICV